MTTNDSQIDLLIRRHAKRPQQAAASDHLDADALNAFAEGVLPAETRTAYVSHLADCADCRKIASGLTVHAGVGASARAQASEVSGDFGASWWRKLSSLFALPALRYAAFASVLIAVVGITFIVWRRSHTAAPELVARNQPEATPLSAVKPEAAAQTNQNGAVDESQVRKALPQPTVMPNEQEKAGRSPAEGPAPPPKPEGEKTVTETQPIVTARAAAPARTEATPSFAPPPPETNETRSREQQNVGGITHGGPRRNESTEKYKVLDRSRSADVAKEEDRMRTANQIDDEKKDKNQPKQAAGSGTFSAGAARDLPSPGRNDALSTLSAEAPTIRSAGGRKFQRQGGAWVDVKFKSTMAVRNISRGSEEFDALDSRLRSIAQQLSGEVVVVWKGKAYRIR